MKGDKQLKAERGYHGKSYVRPDGSEVLLDKRDWDLRKRELWKRAGGRCEYSFSIPDALGKTRCVADGVIPAHVIPRYPVRDDRLSNLKLYCKYHDQLTEKQSWRKTRFGDHQPMQKRRHAQ
jgi:hypothetical protein